MALEPGLRLGPYEIVGPLGSGGMGEVYRARDTRLGREVALKTLPAEVAADPEQRARFEREARAVSSLNHPHICVLHDVGTEDGTDFIVMELLEGQTVADRLEAGPMPVADVLRIGSQMADALEKAHRRGLVHRDLKPANIMLLGSGVAKLLDFGLARPALAAPTGGATALPTMTKPITTQGTVVGTFQYMSPEQVEGKEVDARSDIWSLGATLYEMATGHRPFAGDSTASLISAIMRDQPRAMTELVPLTPSGLQRAVSQALTKDPDDRWQSAGDFKRELEWIADGGATGAAAAPAVAASASAPRPAWFAVGGLALVGLVAAFGGWWLGTWSGPSSEPGWSRFTQLTDMAGAEMAPDLSPDGSSFAYASQAAGTWDIYVQRVGGRNPIPVTADPERDENWPAFSPDGQLIAFSESDAEGGIFVAGATGESVRRVTDFGFNPAWSPDGTRIVFVTEEAWSPYDRSSVSTLWTVAAAGGTPVQVDDLDAMQPAWSPSGERIAVWFQEGGQRDLATVAASGGDRVVLLNDAPLDWSPTWSPDGRYLYFSSDRGGSMGLWRLPIDEASGRAAGEPEPVAGAVEASMGLPVFSNAGDRIVFRSETVSVNPYVIPFDPVSEQAGEPRELLRRTGILSPSSVSPDGRWLAAWNLGERQEDIFLLRTDGSEVRRLTDDIARDRVPRFSPDGSLLTFYSNRSGAYEAYSIRVDGSALLWLSEGFGRTLQYPSLEPDGDRLLVIDNDGVSFYIARPPWPMTPERVDTLEAIALPAGLLQPTTWSPDGGLLAGPIFGRAGSPVGVGIYELATGEGRQLSVDANIWTVAWLPDRRVLYMTGAGELVVIDVDTAERRVIPVDLPLPPVYEGLAAAPDGRALYYGGQRVESNIWMVERGR